MLRLGLLLITLTIGQLLLPLTATASPPPVVVLIMDEFPGAAIEGNHGKVNSDHMPHLASIAKEATYYPNMTTNGDLTIRAVPAISSGQLLESGDISSRQTFYQLLRDSHQVNRSEQFGDLPGLCYFCDNSPLLKSRLGRVPIRTKDLQSTSIKSTLGLSRLLARSDRQPIFWTSHIILPHAPYRFLPSGDQYPLTEMTQNPGIGADKSELYQDRHLPRLAQQRFLLQARYVDRIIGYIKTQMVKGQIWDKSMVIITSDHGASFVPGTYRRGIERGNYTHIANVPLVIKYPGQKVAQVDRGSAQSIDILPTIADVTGISPDWAVDGLSLRNLRPERELRVFGAYGAGWQSYPFDRFVDDRRRLVKSWNNRFPDKAERAWLGANRNLRGKSLSQLRPKRSSSVRASIDLKDRFRRAKPNSGWRPVIVSGLISGARPGRQLFAALNGRIVSTGYVYRVGNQHRFVLLLPESKIRRGSNKVELLTFSGRRLIRVAS